MTTPASERLDVRVLVTTIRKVHTTALVEEEAGTGWALLSRVAGAAGSTLAIEAGRRLAPEQEESERAEYPLDENEPVLAEVEPATA